MPRPTDVLEFLGSQHNPALAGCIADPGLPTTPGVKPRPCPAANRRQRKPAALTGLLASDNTRLTPWRWRTCFPCRARSGSRYGGIRRASDPGKAAALTLLGNRKARAFEPQVLEAPGMPTNRSTSCRTSAGRSGSPDNRTTYCRLLEEAAPAAAPATGTGAATGRNNNLYGMDRKNNTTCCWRTCSRQPRMPGPCITRRWQLPAPNEPLTC